jgi:murein DD-endopeptidase MepM/ murein hydrolase activator NlpD
MNLEIRIFPNRFPLAAIFAVAPAVLLALTVGCGGPLKVVDSTPGRATREAASIDERGSGIYHVVLPRQTLWRIARAYGKQIDEIAAVNGIDDPSLLTVGEALFIPGARAEIYVPAYTETPDANSSGVLDRNWTWPVAGGEILSNFGVTRPGHTHRGLDIRGRPGQDVVAVRGGKVVFSGTMRGYGKTVIVDHGDGYRSLYGHNSRIVVLGGERIEQGQTIARVGKTGNATTEHCHLEIHRSGIAVDPLPFVAQARATRERR